MTGRAPCSGGPGAGCFVPDRLIASTGVGHEGSFPVIPVIQRAVVLPAIEWLRSEPISKCLRELNRTQWYSGDQLRALQWEKLRILIDHCYRNVPFYRRRFDDMGLRPGDIRTLEDYAKLPPLTKDEVRFNQTDLSDQTTRRRVEHCRSGGTLGIPLTLVRDSLASAYARAAELRGFGWFGIRKGDKQVRIWGVPLDPKAARRERRKDFLLNRIRLSTFDLAPESVRAYFETMRRFKGRYIYGIPSVLFTICRIMKDLGLDGKVLRVDFVVCTSETLYPHQRASIQETFGCRVIDEYGCSEIGLIALECPEGGMHLSMENILVEFAERGAGPEHAEILLTNLNSFSMPLLRYAVGDTGQLLNRRCPCGRQLDIMSFDAGRVLSVLMAADGHFIAGSVFCYIAFDIIKKHGGIKDFRVVQKARDAMEITLVKDATFRNEILEMFTGRVREKFGPAMRIEYRFVPEIPPEKSGKRLFVSSEIPESC